MFGYFLVILAGLLSLAAQMYVKSNYGKYSRIGTHRGLNGAQVAQEILRNNGINDVNVIESRGGVLSDHFDPMKKTIALSKDVFYGTSIASVAVAAHEVGHAIQYDTGYAGIGIRNKLLRPAMVASQLANVFILFGIFMIEGSMGFLFDIGLGMLGIVVAFQVLTLPIEFDASNRALKNIKQYNFLDQAEYGGAKSMLTAAALTYVAAVVGTVMNLLRFIMIRNSRRD